MTTKGELPWKRKGADGQLTYKPAMSVFDSGPNSKPKAKPKAKAKAQPKPKAQTACRNIERYGNCNRGDACDFKHAGVRQVKKDSYSAVCRSDDGYDTCETGTEYDAEDQEYIDQVTCEVDQSLLQDDPWSDVDVNGEGWVEDDDE